jgi:hypothetical protein
VIHQRVQWRQRKRKNLMDNIPSFIITNVICWWIFFSSGQSFPWPIFITVFWGLDIAKNAWELYAASNNMLTRQEDWVQQEIEREKARVGLYTKPKRDVAEKSKNRPMQIGSDGEILPLEELLNDEDEQPRYQKKLRQ